MTVDNISKKFCKSLKRSMLYGVQDILHNIAGHAADTSGLRPDEFWAVNGVSFSLERGETLGLIGPNGSGKSTLLKMLNGIFMPDRGRITICGRVGALIEVGAGFHPMLTGRENVYVNGAILGMKKSELDKKFDAIVDFAGIPEFIDTPVKHYSSGMYVRLGFAVAIHCMPDILLIDEILAVGDEGFQSKCFNIMGQLRENGTSIVLVSHNMHTVSTFSDRVILLDRGKATEFKNVAEGVKEYSRLFQTSKDMNMEKICSGNDAIRFFDPEIPRRNFAPGESFSITLPYESLIAYQNVEIDTAIFGDTMQGLYFQATNAAYQQPLNLLRGRHTLKIMIQNIPLNNASVKIAIAVWAEKRTSLLFWWRIPVEFISVAHSTGKNFLLVTYGVD
ncbi:MAG: ABC transporter ATP-binding protein [Proteobacteria bacterium]|nr:ABC transporter ATP-binding protein [Pseudomonadota bacterium]